MLGAFINGFQVTGASYGGGTFDWLTPFSLFTGVGLLVVYALLGSSWLIMKTEGALQQRMIALARPITLSLLGSSRTPHGELAHYPVGAFRPMSPSVFNSAQKAGGIRTVMDSASSVIWRAVRAPGITVAATSGMAANCSAAVRRFTPWASATAERRARFSS